VGFGATLTRSRGGAVRFAALVLVGLIALAGRSASDGAAALVIATAPAVLGVLGLGLWIAARHGATREHAAAAAELQALRTAAQLAGTGEWRWDLRSQRITYGRGCAAMLGYAEGDIDSALSAWGKLAHPEDLPRVRAAVDAMVEGRADGYEERVRLRAADGSWRAIVDRGKVVARDRDGRPTLAIGVHVDATADIATLGTTCIVVDDDATVRTTIESAARRVGIAVLGFADADTAWKAIAARGEPRAIVTDLELPGMSGLELAARVRAAGMRCPVLLVSGALPPEGVESDDVTGVLAKPFSLAELTTRLGELVPRSKA
jgi:CheY-like chemotaxis protein/PAS domain-containing protein